MAKDEKSRESLGRGERLFLENIHLFESIAVGHARRRGLSPEDAEDFRQELLARLYLNDCEVLRNFRGRSSLDSYVKAIAAKAFVDYLAARTGRWRPSTMARSLGPVAVELERLMVLEGLPGEVAITTLSNGYGGLIDVERLRGISDLLPHRTVRRHEGEESLASMSARRGDPHAEMEGRESVRLQRRLEELLPGALATLDGEETLLLKLTLLEENRISQLSRSWGRDDQELYRARRRALKKLRRYLVERGIRPEEIRWLLDRDRT